MPQQRTLTIKKTSRPDFSKIWKRNACIAFLFIGIPLFAVVRFQESNSILYGDVTNNLLQDVSASYASPKPFKSSWREHHLLLSNYSEYRGSPSNNLNVMETFIALFTWRSFLIISLYMIGHLIKSAFWIMGIHVVVIKSHFLQYTLFLLFSICFAILLVLAADGFVSISFELTQDLARWLESSIIHVGPLDMSMNTYETQVPHPFTMGIRNPYFLQKKFRYIGEDAHFVCEYKILGANGAKPIFASSWWNKDGVPVVTNDRLFVNVTIEPTYEDDDFLIIGMRYFTVRNTLTIHMVQMDDYGQYTCVYHDPMIIGTIVEPIFKKYKKSQMKPAAPMSPHPDCSCKPHTSVSRKDTSIVNAFDITECFAEFELKPRRPPQQDVYVGVPIGGILKTSFNYVTLADVSDVAVDDTFPEQSSTECCSAMTKLYWILFREGGFVTLPISRAAWSNDSTEALNFGKWMCVCKDSPTRHRAKIYRKVLNLTLNVWETVDIDHPITLVLNAPNNGTAPFIESLYFCDGSTSSLCQLCDAILENSFCTLYGVDIMILFLAYLHYCILGTFQTWSKKYLSIPLRKSCLIDLPTPFEAVRGPQIKQLQRARSAVGENTNFENNNFHSYDIYFTYCQDNSFDKAVAQVFKQELVERGLTLFDPYVDILPGHPVGNEIHAAIHHSTRFVVLASHAFQEDHFKELEFDSINDTIRSQGTNAKSRLLMVRLGQCEINGLHRVPCIFIPNTERENFELNECYIYRLREWENATRPSGKGRPHTNSIWTDLRLRGFNWMSGVCFLILMFFARYSFLFATDKEHLQAREAKNMI